MKGVHGAVAVVTGAGSGIGAALASALASRGAAAVIVADVDATRADTVAARIAAAGGRADPAMVDVTDAAAVGALIESTSSRHGRLDYLFNNAGLGLWGDLRDVTRAQWQQVLDVNLMGVVHGVQAAYPLMAEQGFGHIVNTASLAGLVPAPGVVPYAAAKHAVVGLSLALRAEAQALGVKVSVACPGPVRTNFHASLLVTSRQMRGPRSPARAPGAEAAARRVLAGVARNRAVIVFPPRAHLMWLAYRLLPRLLAPLGRRVAAGVHRARGQR
jgi:NAD(P)-dependent dehydrogenase (short-subunit alcohol dehydrogenase family)